MSVRKRNPFEVASLVGSVVVGVALVGGYAWPSEIENEIPTWFNIAWGGLFVSGAFTSLTGAHLQNRANGILLEQVGLAAIGVTCFIGGALLAFVADDAAIVVVSLLFFILGFACVAQWLRIETTIGSIVNRKGRTGQV